MSFYKQSLFFYLISLLAACAPIAEQLAEDITPRVIEQGLETIARPETAQAIEDILSRPEVERAMMRLSDTAVDSAVTSLSREEHRQLIEHLSLDITQAVIQQLTEKGSPMVEEFASTAIQTINREIINELDREELSNFIADLSRAATRAATEELQENLPDLFQVTADPAFRESLLPLAYAIALQATYATNDALLHLEEEPEEATWFPDPDFLTNLAVVGVFALAGIVIVLLIILARLVAVIRRQRREMHDYHRA